MYILCAPHLEIGGWHNNGEILYVGDSKLLLAHKGNTWLAIGTTIPFTEASCGYVGVNDGWTDLADNYRLDWHYDEALDGNIALAGGLDLSHGTEFTVGVAFGTTQHDALSTLGQSLNIPFEQTREAFIHQWEQTSKRFSLASMSNNAKLYERSVNLLLAHEDKTYSGAMIASLSIPWGDQKSDDELGGYHLVWTRDLVKSVTGLLAAGDTSTPLRSLIYLAVSQREDGGFYQNFWLDGRPYWAGIQLDEVAFPVLLTWRLWKNKAWATSYLLKWFVEPVASSSAKGRSPRRIAGRKQEGIRHPLSPYTSRRSFAARSSLMTVATTLLPSSFAITLIFSNRI